MAVAFPPSALLTRMFDGRWRQDPLILGLLALARVVVALGGEFSARGRADLVSSCGGGGGVTVID